MTDVVDAVKAPTRGRSGRLLPCFDVDRGTDAWSLRSSAAGLRLRRRRPRHAAHVVDPLPLLLLLLTLLLLTLPLVRVLSSMLRLYVRVIVF